MGSDSDCNVKAVSLTVSDPITQGIYRRGINMFQKQYEDSILVDTYLKYKSQIKAANELGCSRETVARAVRRAGIKLNGRKYNRNGGSPRKITDRELIEESKAMTRQEIAEKHRMCISNIDRKLHRLGIRCVSAEATGQTKLGRGGKYYGRIQAAGFNARYDSKVTLKRLLKKQNGICQLCGRPVDVSDRAGLRMGNNYPTVDHIVPFSLGGSHTWDNVQLAHMICNSIKCANAVGVS